MGSFYHVTVLEDDNMVCDHGVDKKLEHSQNYKHNVYKVRYTCWGSLSDRKKHQLHPAMFDNGYLSFHFSPLTPTSEPLSLSGDPQLRTKDTAAY